MSIYKLSGSLPSPELEQFLYNSQFSETEQGTIRKGDIFTAVDFGKLPQNLKAKFFSEYQRFQSILSTSIQITQEAEFSDYVTEGIRALLFGAFACADPALRRSNTPEICNGQDDNNNGQTDESLDRACYTGPANTRNVGECKDGIQKCVNGQYGLCKGEVTPTAEICDGKDNTCDGNTDEGVLNACDKCGPTPEEICDGIDNNCNGEIDEGVKNLCGTCGDDCERMTKTDGRDLHPSVVWTGQEFGIAWEKASPDFTDFTNSEIRFMRVDSDGHLIPNSDTKIASGFFPHLVWTGNEYGITWYSSYSQYFVRLNSQGQKIGSDAIIFGNAVGGIVGGASLAWNGDGFGIALTASDNKIYFIKLDRTGNVVGPAQTVLTGLDPYHNDNHGYGPDLAWSENNYGLAFAHIETFGRGQATGAIYFLSLDRDGNPIGNFIRVGNGELFGGNHFRPSIAWSPAFHQYGIARIQDDELPNDRGLYLTAINGNAFGIDSNILHSNINQPSLAAGANSYGIAWGDFRNGRWELFFREADRDGTLITPELRKTQNFGIYSPALISAGNVYGLAWSDLRDGNFEIYFSIMP